MNVNKVVIMGRLTYDPEVRQSGNGKDPSKVDRSAAYMANYIARDLVKNHGLKSCEVQIAYAIGESAPMSVSVKSSSQVGKERSRTNESGVKIPRRKVANIRMDYLTFSRTQSIL